MSTGKIELSVGAVKYVDPNEIITEEEYNYIKNKVPELDGRVGVIEDEIEEINSSLDNIVSDIKSYVIKNDEWNIYNDGTNAIETTKNINKAIKHGKDNGYNYFILQKGTYLIDGVADSTSGIKPSKNAGIYMYSNTTLDMSNDVVLKVNSNSSCTYALIQVTDKNGDITIKGGTLIGDRETHNYNPSPNPRPTHEFGFGIYVDWNTKGNITIDGVNISEMTGDGIITASNNITIKNCTVSKCRRNNIAIVHGENIKIHDNNIFEAGINMEKSNGTAPRAGIDLEPYREVGGGSDWVNNVFVYQNRFSNNVYSGVTNYNSEYVWINDNLFKNDTLNLGYSAHNKVFNNLFYSDNNTNYAISSIGNAQTLVTEDNNIYNNTIDGYTCAIDVRIDGFDIYNNTIRNVDNAIKIYDTVQSTTKIYGNDIYNIKNSALSMVGNSKGVSIELYNNSISMIDSESFLNIASINALSKIILTHNIINNGTLNNIVGTYVINKNTFNNLKGINAINSVELIMDNNTFNDVSYGSGGTTAFSFTSQKNNISINNNYFNFNDTNNILFNFRCVGVSSIIISNNEVQYNFSKSKGRFLNIQTDVADCIVKIINNNVTSKNKNKCSTTMYCPSLNTNGSYMLINNILPNDITQAEFDKRNNIVI